MRILITGAAGFVGIHLMTMLSGKNEVIGVDNFKHNVDPRYLEDQHLFCYHAIKYADCAVNFETAANFKDLDAIVHLAATINVDYSVEEPWQSLYNNIIGTLNVAETCRKHDLKMIHASTCEVYGSNVDERKPQAEDHPLRPFSPYGASKLAGEKICESYTDTYGMKINVLRPFNIFGTYQRGSSYGAAISIFTNRVLAGEPPEIFGDGYQTRDYTYIPDILQAYNIALKRDFGGKPVNFGSGREVTINELASTICKLCGRADIEPVHVKPRVRELRRSWCDDGRARIEFGYKPVYFLEKGLEEFIKWRKSIEGLDYFKNFVLG